MPRSLFPVRHAEICERGFDPDLNSFVQAYGSKCVDASLLLMPLVGFLPAADPRVRGTLKAIEDRLLIDREFVLRYETRNTGDGLPPGEGAFWRAASGSSITMCCKVAMRKPANSSIGYWRGAMTWVCSPNSLIRSLAECLAIFPRRTAMSA